MDATPTDPCTSEDVSDFYTQAAAHPNFGITAFELNTGAFEVPEGNVKDIKVEPPEGLGVNQEATEQCTVAQLASSTCPPGSLVGTNYLRAIVAAGPPPVVATIPVPVYNVSLDPGDQHIFFTNPAGASARPKRGGLTGPISKRCDGYPRRHRWRAPADHPKRVRSRLRRSMPPGELSSPANAPSWPGGGPG